MTTVTSYGIDRWNVSGKQIVLFRQDDETSAKLKYRIEDEQTNAVEIPSRLYSNIYRTCNNVLLFHDVIQANLHHSIEPYSFIPVLESTAEIKQLEQYVPIEHLKVALFGRGDSNTKTVHGAHWGIFNERDNSTKIVLVQKIEGDLQECLVNVLCNRYYVSFYADHRIEVSLDSDGQVQSLALTILSRPSFYSIFDTSVSLDENHWAVTLISTKQNFTQERIHAGHAMIACEGVKEGCKFLEYVHITKRAEKGDTNKSFSGARVEALERVNRQDIRNGPTWRRARSAVENILVLAQKAQQERQILPFALGKNIYKMAFPVGSICLVIASIFAARYDYRNILAFHSYFYVDNSLISFMLHRIISMSQTARSFFWSWGFTYRYGLGKSLRRAGTSLMTASLAGASAYVSKKLSDRYDCLSWAVEQLSKAGVHIRLPLSIVTPNSAIEYLNLHVKVVVLKDS
jgi:hypothetical protein